jgi:hypothetical protein
MPIPETTVDIRFGASDQRRYGKFLLPGQLDLAINVVQVEGGLYEKRDGYLALDRFTSAEEAEDDGPGGGDEI